MLELVELLDKGLAQHRIAVTQGADGYAGDRIEVLVAVAVPDPNPLTSHQFEGISGIGIHHRRGDGRDGSGGTRTHMPEGARF